ESKDAEEVANPCSFKVFSRLPVAQELCHPPRFVILSEGESPNRRTPKKSANPCSFKVFSRLPVTQKQKFCHPERSRGAMAFHEKSLFTKNLRMNK
ncbi:MAG TPA: hypothetical protein VK657_08990, partial [Terriglobales bacterium]|nr:hypothetical protein [Terriglobales bacterium]